MEELKKMEPKKKIKYEIKNEEILFFDLTLDINYIQKKNKKDDLTIITLDYESHQILEKYQINHISSDSFIKKFDLEKIQKKSYQFAKWASDEKIKKKFLYHGVNIGELPYVELHYELLPLLKKIMCIENIIKFNSKKKYLCSENISKILKLFNVELEIIPEAIELKKTFLYDSVEIPIDLGIAKSITISKKNYTNIKKIIDKFVKILSKKNYKISKNENLHLFCECDIIKMGDLLNNHSIKNILIYNKKRPIIHNWESFKIIKNSKIKIHGMVDVSQKNNELIDKFLDIINDDSFFMEFFVINNIPFWSSIKNLFLQLYKKRFQDAINEIHIIENIFEKFSILSVTVWSESGFNEQIVIQIAKANNKKINLFQHGIFYDSLQAKEYNEFNGIIPVKSDNFFAWGIPTIEYIKKIGYNKKFYDVGSIFYQSLKFQTPSEEYILLTTTSPGKNISFDLRDETIKKYEENIKKICMIVKKFNKKLIIKIHPFQDEMDITKLIKEIDENISVIKYGNSINLISSCLCLISIDLSTTILEAQLMNKPTIAIKTKDLGLGVPSIFDLNITPYIEIDDLEIELHKIFYDSIYRDNIIKSGEIFSKKFLSYDKYTINSLVKIFED